VLTDLEDVLPRIRHNCEANMQALAGDNSLLTTIPEIHSEPKAVLEGPGRLGLTVLEWGVSNTSPFQPCDILLACEVVYSADANEALMKTLSTFCSKETETLVLFGASTRGRVGLRDFLEAASEMWNIEEIPDEELHPQYIYSKVKIMRFRKRG